MSMAGGSHLHCTERSAVQVSVTKDVPSHRPEAVSLRESDMLIYFHSQLFKTFIAL